MKSISLANYWSFVSKTLLDDRPKQHVCKFQEIHSKSAGCDEICRFNVDSIDSKSEIHRFLNLNLWISKLKSADFNEIRSHLSDLNMERSTNERPLARKVTPHIYYCIPQFSCSHKST